MLERFRAHLDATGLVPAGERPVLVGYSGGPDSTCLLQLLVLCGVDVVAAHLHHGQREEAEREMERCGAYCEELGVPFMPGRADVPAMAKALGMGLEEAGRRARYEFFHSAAGAMGCRLIATAHTRDDLLETLVLNLCRGTGLRGLSGIPERRDGIVRPLLPFTRAETREYCTDRGLWTHDDPANVDLSFARARVRHRVLPELRAVHPGCEDAMVRLATVAGEEDALLDSMAAAALERCEIALNGPLRFLTLDVEAAFERPKLLHLPRPMLRRAMRLAASTLGGVLTFEQTESLCAGVERGGKGSVTCERGTVKADWTDETVWFEATEPLVPLRYALENPGETVSDGFGWKFEVGGTTDSSGVTAVVAPEALRGDLYFRAPNAGDTVDVGGGATKRVGDLFSAAHLSPMARRRLPIVCDMVGPVWIPGVRVAARVACETGLVLRFGPLSDATGHNQ